MSSLVFISDTPVARSPSGRLCARAVPSVFFCELSEYFDGFVLDCPFDDQYSEDAYPYPLPNGIELSPRPYLVRKVDFFRSPAAVLGHIRAIWKDIGRSDYVFFRGPTPLIPVVFSIAAIRRKRSRLTYYCAGDLVTRNRDGGLRGLVAKTYGAMEAAAAKRMNLVVAGKALQDRLGGAVLFANMIRSAELAASVDDLIAADRAKHVGDVARVLSVGNLDANKDLASLLTAVSLSSVPIALDVVGDGPEMDALVGRARDLGIGDTVTFHGRIGDRDLIEKLYRSAALFVLSSLSEGVPKVLLEAASFGVPIVATDVGGVPFLVAADDAARLVSAGDGGELAAAIDEVLGDEHRRAELIENGYGMANRYAKENMLRSFADAIRGS